MMSTKLEETLQIIKKVNQQFKNPVSEIIYLDYIIFCLFFQKKKKNINLKYAD